MLNKKLVGVTALVLFGLVFTAAYNRPFRWWPFNDMSEQEFIKPFTENSLRAPAEGSVAVDQWDPVPLKTELTNYPDFKNPVAATAESVQQGGKLFGIYCYPCHGQEMSPDPEKMSPVQKKGMPGANLLLVRNYSDEHIFATITHGSAIMKRMSYHLSPEERWHVVNYIRSLINNTANQ